MKYTKEEFKQLVRMKIKRKGIEDLLSALDRTDFYTAPASTRYHHSYKGGLKDHSMEVWSYLDDLVDGKGFDEESVAIVGLFHDLCKVEYYVEDTRNVKENGKWIQVPYYTTDDKLPLGHGDKSIIMILEHMKLTIEEMMAIRWHMGGYSPKEEYGSLSKAYEQFPLAVYTHFADMSSTYLEEGAR